jgi:hypothetical protein
MLYCATKKKERINTREMSDYGLDIVYDFKILGKSGRDSHTTFKAGAHGLPDEKTSDYDFYTDDDIEIKDVYLFGEEMPECFKFFVPKTDTFDINDLTILDLLTDDCLNYLNEV